MLWPIFPLKKERRPSRFIKKPLRADVTSASTSALVFDEEWSVVISCDQNEAQPLNNSFYWTEDSMVYINVRRSCFCVTDNWVVDCVTAFN